MKVALGCDHAAFNLKTAIIKLLNDKGVEYLDFGAVSAETPVDYPESALKAAEAVAAGKADFGIVICGTGVGVSITANKVKGIRCALCPDVFTARATREHNNTNMLAMGERTTGMGNALDIVAAFLFTPFSHAERHIRRNKMVDAVETKYFK